MILNRRQLTILWIGLGLFLTAYIWDNLFSGERNLVRYKNTIESYLHGVEKTANETLADKEFLDRRLKGVMSGSAYKKDVQRLEALAQEEFNYCIFKDDSLVFWTHSDVLPLWSDFSDPSLNKTCVKLVKYNSSQYELRYQNSVNTEGAKVIAAALIPLKMVYPTFEGEFLENHFTASRFIPIDFNLTDNNKLKYFLSTSEGQKLCYLNNEDATADMIHDIGMFSFLFMGFFLIGIFGDRIAKQMLRQYQTPVIGTMFFFIIMALMRLCILWIQHSDVLPYFDLRFGDFNRAIFVKSLSELMIDTGFLFWFSIFLNSEFRLPDFRGQPLWVRWTLAGAFYCAIVLLIILCIGIFNDLVTNWNNLLAFDNLSDFNFKSIVALLGVGIILFSVFLLSHRSIVSVNELNLNNFQHFIAIDIAVSLGILMFRTYDLNLPMWVYIVFIFLYITIFQQFIRNKKPGLIWLVQWILAFSAIQAFFISKFNVQKDIKIIEDYAENLALERDTVAERRIKFLTTKIEKDPSIQTISTFPVRFDIDPKRIENIIMGYFNTDEYLSNHYSFRFFSFYRNGEALTQTDSFDLRGLLKQYDKGQLTDKNSSRLRFWSNKKGEYSYISVAEVPVMPDNPIYVAMELERHDKLSSRVFTELFVDKHYKSLPRLNDYSYAIYKNGVCTEQNQSGVYDKFINYSDTPNKGEFRHTKLGDRDELIYQNSDGVVVRIGKSTAVSSQGFILWMYLVIMLCTLLLVLALCNHYIGFLPEVVKFNFSFSFQSSLRNRILFPSIAFVLFSYIAIFYFTVRYFKNLDERYYNSDLESKINSIVTHVIEEINEMHKYDIFTPENISNMLQKYSQNYQNAMHFFSPDGELYTTTELNIFDKGIISKRMDAGAYMHLKSGIEKMYKTDENIGKFHYKTAYYAINDSLNHTLGFLELPFYSRDRKMRLGASEIWTYNATVLTLLFFIGICAIYFLTARNMQPIQHIADRLRRLSLGNQTKNELITWDKKDEISALIDAYNNKVIELEDTYTRLSEAEREGAWRDMAKQVAHEIRNPLTPMKLIVQHLEMIRRQKPDNIEEYLIRSNKVLLDQIDNLEKIVSEFASFAKMPQKASNQMFVLNDLVSSVGNLFSQKEDGKQIEFTLSVPEELYTIYADRTLLTGAFNNLVKNAIQAIPDDREGRIVVSLYKRSTTAVVRISDNGTGIPKDIQDKIFSPNFTTKQYGSGIGLLITKNIITSVNGRIHFETVENEGTDFFVEFDIQSIESPEGSTDTPSVLNPKSDSVA